MSGQVVHDRLLQRRHAPERSTANVLLGDLGEGPLHLVQPRSTGRRGMERVLGMTLEPSLHRGRLVRPIIVHDDVDLHAGLAGDLAIDLLEKLEELPRPMPLVALADHPTGGDIQRGERRGRPVADVVVSPTLGPTGSHRQEGPCPIRRLDLALLVDRQDDDALRRAHVEADDVADLLDEVGVGRELERPALMRLEAESPPDPDDGTPREADRLGHLPRAPAGGGLGLLLEGLGDDFLDVGVGDCSWCPGPWPLSQPFETVFEETLAPLADGHDVDTEPSGDDLVFKALGRVEDDLGTDGKALSALGSRRPALELLTLFVGRDQRGFGATTFAHHMSHSLYYMMKSQVAQG